MKNILHDCEYYTFKNEFDEILKKIIKKIKFIFIKLEVALQLSDSVQVVSWKQQNNYNIIIKKKN